MMFGTRDEFEYFECAQCGCLQISNPPEEMSKYYPSDYYSPETATAHRISKKDRVMAPIVRNRLIADSGLAISLLGLVYSKSSLLNSLKKAHVSLNSKILEVGCGQGVLMLALKNWGFKDVTGVDPYCQSKIHPDLSILNTSVDELQKTQNLIS